MFKLRKLNVVKLVDSKLKRDKLIEKGFVEIQTPISINEEETNKNVDIYNLKWPELKQFASDKGINTYEMKKEEIIKALEELEG